jgi:hypothetical protein
MLSAAFRTLSTALLTMAWFYVTGGRYQENVVINKPLFLLGPNVGIPGDAPQRRPEAKVIPIRSDPENTPIISVESDQVVIDGFLLDGSNPNLSGGYNANGVPVHAGRRRPERHLPRSGRHRA